MSICGLDIGDLVKRIEARCEFASVGLERDLKEATLNGLTFNTAFVLHGGGKASFVPNAHVINQYCEPRFGVVMVARSYARQTLARERAIQDMQQAIREALIGWCMPGADSPMYLVNEAPLKTEKVPSELMIWMDELQTRYQFEVKTQR
ncbi:hypothetical protein HC761_00710 [bacterium]|nr:hypothetical protein [bacterium]